MVLTQKNSGILRSDSLSDFRVSSVLFMCHVHKFPSKATAQGERSITVQCLTGTSRRHCMLLESTGILATLSQQTIFGSTSDPP
jgi:hypothetical protein